MDHMRGRVCLVTGATRGLGRATATSLAALGARVVMLVRDVDAGARVRDAMAVESGSDDIAVVRLDLASLDSVREAAAVVSSRYEAIHVLVNNAGVNLSRRALSAAGLEMTFAVNHLGPFLLTELLRPILVASAPARVVTVTSWFERLGRVHFDDLQLERGYTAFRAYAQSKLANVLFTYELARRLAGTDVSANCVHPGLVATDLMRDLPRRLRVLYEPFLARPERAADAIVRLAVAPELDGVTGRYFDRGREGRSSGRSRNLAAARRLWEVSEALTRATSG